MRHRVEHHVDAERVAVGRELQEELVVLAFALPRVADVGVVRHRHHDAAVAIGDGAEIGMWTVASPLARIAAGSAPREDAGYLLDLDDVEQCVSDRIARCHVDDRELGQTRRISPVH